MLPNSSQPPNEESGLLFAVSPVRPLSEFLPKRKEESFASYKAVPPDTRPFVKRVTGLSIRFIGTWIVILAAIGLGVVGCLSLHFSGAVIQLVKYALVGGGTVWAWAKYHLAPESVRQMMDMPPIQPQFPVQITCLTKEKKQICCDEGLITFVDGRLLFEGRRFHLDFDTEVLVNNIALRERLALDRRGKPIVMVWQGYAAGGTIRINVYDQVRGVGKDFQKQFRKTLREWTEERAVEGGRHVLPPMLPDRYLVERYVRLRNGAIGVSVALLVAEVLTLFIFHPGFQACMLGVIVLVLVLYEAWNLHALINGANDVIEQRTPRPVPTKP